MLRSSVPEASPPFDTQTARSYRIPTEISTDLVPPCPRRLVFRERDPQVSMRSLPRPPRHTTPPPRASGPHRTVALHPLRASPRGVLNPSVHCSPATMEPPFSHSLPRTQVPQLSRQNHYVAKWYQKRFILGSRGTLHRLDLDAPPRHLPDGRKVAGRDIRLRSPKRCFVQQDLYTTRIGRMINDDVERFLFGPIDRSGALAVRAFAGNDYQAIHNHFRSLFEYLDAQKLRTPKGSTGLTSGIPT